MSAEIKPYNKSDFPESINKIMNDDLKKLVARDGYLDNFPAGLQNIMHLIYNNHQVYYAVHRDVKKTWEACKKCDIKELTVNGKKYICKECLNEPVQYETITYQIVPCVLAGINLDYHNGQKLKFACYGGLIHCEFSLSIPFAQFKKPKNVFNAVYTSKEELIKDLKKELVDTNDVINIFDQEEDNHYKIYFKTND